MQSSYCLLNSDPGAADTISGRLQSWGAVLHGWRTRWRNHGNAARLGKNEHAFDDFSEI